MSDKAFNPNEHLRNLKGQSYLDVKYRLQWLNEDAENKGLRFSLTTDLLRYDEARQEYTFKATLEIYNENGELLKRTTGTGTETYKDFPSGPAEKSETKAIGRALGHAGFGTQFALEFEPDGNDDGERIVDSPVSAAKPTPRPPAKPVPAQGEGTAQLKGQVSAALAADKEAAGKLPKPVDDMNCEELTKTLSWLKDRAKRAREEGR